MKADRLANSVVVVTGATGIAAASAECLATEGAQVFVISRTEANCRELVARLSGLGTEAGYAVADLTNEEAAEAAFASCLDRFGSLNGLLAVAGGSGRRYGDGPIHGMSLDAWNQTNTINGDPSFLAAREAVRAMRSGGGGSIALVSSVLATHPSPGLFATHGYAAVKGGQLSLVRSLAAYYAKDQIRVNGLTPSLIETPMSKRASEDPSTLAYVSTKQPLADGMLPASAVADAALFLLSDDARYITGQVLAVDGGWSVTEAG